MWESMRGRRCTTELFKRARTSALKSCNGMRRNGFAAADLAHAFVRFCFQIYSARRNIQCLRQSGSHRWKMRPQLGPFADDDCVDMRDTEAALVEQLARLHEKRQARGALPLRVPIGEMRADIAEAPRAKQSVAKGVTEHVAIGMPHRPFFERNFDAADHEFAAFGEAVKVVANSGARHPIPLLDCG